MILKEYSIIFQIPLVGLAKKINCDFFKLIRGFNIVNLQNFED